MERYLIENYGNNEEMIEWGFSWLESNGGGYAVADLKKNLVSIFDYKGWKFDIAERRMMARGIMLAWGRRFICRDGNVFAIYPTDGLLEDLERCDRIEKLLVLGWNEVEYAEWRDRYHPTLIEGGNPHRRSSNGAIR